MNAKNKVFLDTNLPVYAHTNVDVPKQQKIQHIITTENTVISTQVFKEAANVLSKKFGFAWKDIQKVLQEMGQNNEVFINTLPTIRQACQIAERYGFSFYDSLVLAAALEAGCPILYSEDLQHGQIIGQGLTVKNPFL
ncbi:MAG TPA: PIN domain-containing protein [Phaeodactylibacter sp.]|nr:PIN domain-containing protein [Phaeodactylibacter sp.]